jgi:hypothetical protein
MKCGCLPEQLIFRIAGQVDERRVCEHDRVAGKRRVGDDHRHPSQPHRFDEYAALLAKRVEVALRQVPRCGVRQIFPKVVDQCAPRMDKPIATA